eukprot:scaffold2856_cov47-Attheya_sp.AAC.3
MSRSLPPTRGERLFERGYDDASTTTIRQNETPQKHVVALLEQEILVRDSKKFQLEIALEQMQSTCVSLKGKLERQANHQGMIASLVVTQLESMDQKLHRFMNMEDIKTVLESKTDACKEILELRQMLQNSQDALQDMQGHQEGASLNHPPRYYLQHDAFTQRKHVRISVTGKWNVNADEDETQSSSSISIEPFDQGHLSRPVPMRTPDPTQSACCKTDIQSKLRSHLRNIQICSDSPPPVIEIIIPRPKDDEDKGIFKDISPLEALEAGHIVANKYVIKKKKNVASSDGVNNPRNMNHRVSKFERGKKEKPYRSDSQGTLGMINGQEIQPNLNISCTEETFLREHDMMDETVKKGVDKKAGTLLRLAMDSSYGDNFEYLDLVYESSRGGHQVVNEESTDRVEKHHMRIKHFTFDGFSASQTNASDASERSTVSRNAIER